MKQMEGKQKQASENGEELVRENEVKKEGPPKMNLRNT